MDCPRCGAFNSMLDTECADCGAPLGDTAAEESATEAAVMPEPQRAPAAPASAGQRVAGGLLLLSAATALTIRFAMPAFFRIGPDLALPGAAVNAALGLALLLGVRRFVVPAVVCVAALAVWHVLAVGDVALGVSVGAFELSIVVLVVGQASRARIAAGCSLFCAAWVVPFALRSLAPAAAFNDKVRPVDLSGKLRVLAGRSLPYNVPLPGDDWHALTAAARARTASKTDAVAVDVKTGAVVRSYVDLHKGIVPSIDTYVSGILDPLKGKRGVPADLGPLHSYPHRSRVVRVAWTENGADWTGLRAMIVGDGGGLEIDASIPIAPMPEERFRRILEGARVEPSALREPPDCAPLANGRVDEPDVPVTMELAGGDWCESSADAAARRGVPAPGRVWQRPFQGLVIAVVSRGGVPIGTSAASFADRGIDALRTAGNAPEHVRSLPQSRGAGFELRELEVIKKSGRYAAWIATVIAGDKSAIADAEVPLRARDAVAADVLSSLATLTFRKQADRRR